jgi:hypothetical protein
MYGIDYYTKLLLKGEGADASTVIVDSALGKIVTPYNHTQIDTEQKKFGASSILFDGADDYITVPDSDDWNFGSGDYTIDFQVRFNGLPTDATAATFFDQYIDANNRTIMNISNDGGTYYIRFRVVSTTDLIAVVSTEWPVTVSTGVWYHFALARNGTSHKLFHNGTQAGSTVTATYTWPNLASVLFIGGYNGSSSPLNGWLDEFRISKGIARWTANFIPPSSEYTTYKNRYLTHIGRNRTWRGGVSKGYVNG